MDEELTQKFIDLVMAVLSPDVNKAIANGSVDVHIGFHEVDTSTTYDFSTIRPFVNIIQVNTD